MKRLSYIWIPVLLFSLFPLAGEEYLLEAIRVEGLKRTRESTVFRIIRLEPGMTVNESTPGEAEQRLQESGIFRNGPEAVLVPGDTGTAVLEIRLEERWTLLPLPAGFVSADEWLAGLVVIESNLAGLGQTLVAGGFLTGDSSLGFAAWENPSVFGSKYSLGLGTSFNLGLTEFLSPDGETVLASFDGESVSGTLRLGREYRNGLGWKIASGILSLSAGEITGYLPPGDQSSLYWQNRLGLEWKDLYYVSFFNRGWSAEGEAAWFLPASGGSPGYSVTGSLSRTFLVADRHLLKASLRGGRQEVSDFYPLLLGGAEGSRALPMGDVAARGYAAGLLSLEAAVFRPAWGVFTVPLYYEGGVFQPQGGGDPEIWHGPGFGFRFYVDKVAIPALGADFTWNLERGIFKVAVSLGSMGG